MRLALLSDVHGNLPALEAVAADLSRRGVDAVACLGDHVSGPLLPRETAQFLMATDWTMLAGNHERQVLELRDGQGGPSDVYARETLGAAELDWMRGLVHCRPFGADALLCHGTPRSDCENFLETVRGGAMVVATGGEVTLRLGDTRATLIACGHTHVPRSARLASGALVVNPGSVGLQAYLGEHPEPFAMQMGTPDAHYAIVERAGSGWTCTHHAVPYDAAPMAALARDRGRPDWAAALATGYVR